MTTKRIRSALHAHALVAPTTERARKIALDGLDQFIAFAGDDPRGWTRLQALAFYRHLREAEHPRAAQIMGALREAAEALGDGAWATVHIAPGKGASAREPLTEPQLRALLDTCRARTPRDLRDFALMVLAVETGLRRAALAQATWADLKAKPYPSLDGTPISATAALALAPWRAWLTGRRAARGTIARSLSRRDDVGGAVTAQAIYALIEDRADQTDVGRVHPHTFRTTFIRWRLAAGVAPDVVAAVVRQHLPGSHARHATRAQRATLTPAGAAEICAATPAWLVAYVDQFVEPGPRAGDIPFG